VHLGVHETKLMREVTGLHPYSSPMASVKVKVPAKVPFGISIVDCTRQTYFVTPSKLAASSAG